MSCKLIVLSLDAMIQEDLAQASQYPNFAKLLEKGARVQHIESIYPTLTYPCHTTMITGCFPDKHGVVSNTILIPGKKQLPWRLDHGSVLCEDIHDVCKRAGYSTASVGWPVTGNHPTVDFLLDEAWPEGEFSLSTFEEAYLKTGTPKWMMDDVVKPYLCLRVPKKQPGSTYFLINVSCEVIKRYKPDILTIHVGNIDAYRHNSGVFSQEVSRGIAESDAILGQIMEAAKEAGVFDNTNFVVTSDHGQLNVARTIKINTLLIQHGYITTDANGNVSDWKAWCFSNGMSAIIQMKDPNDADEEKRLYALLTKLASDGVWGFSKVNKANETANADRYSGPFSFVLESDNYTEFIDDWNEPVVNPYNLGDYGIIHGCHGYHPSKGPSPIFIGYGPSFKEGVTLENAHLVDEAPTFAALMGVQLPNADGYPMEGLLR